METENLTLKQNIQYLRMASAITGISLDDKSAEIIIHIYEGILQKGGNLSLMDICKIEQQVADKITEIDVQEIPTDKYIRDITDDIISLNLCNRAYNFLKNNSVNTITELLQYSERDLLKFRNMGKLSVANIKTELNKYGLKLKG